MKTRGVSCEILNAKLDALEAGIIANAGKYGAVTIFDQYGRTGTDIRLGGPDEKDKERVVALGGLYVIGVSRNESLRIDNQLPWARQAGREIRVSSRFFVSLEDELYKKYRLNELLPSTHAPIDSPIIRRELRPHSEDHRGTAMARSKKRIVGIRKSSNVSGKIFL